MNFADIIGNAHVNREIFIKVEKRRVVVGETLTEGTLLCWRLTNIPVHKRKYFNKYYYNSIQLK